MTGRTHDLIAFTSLSVVVVASDITHLTLATAVAAVIANQIGGITPDIDEPTAPLWRNLPSLRFLGKFFGKISGGHRFLTHSAPGMALFGLLAELLLKTISPLMPNVNTGFVWWSFMIGLFSHLLADTFTKEGVPWLLPLPFKFGLPPLKKLRLTTGKTAESLIVFPGILMFNIFFYAANYNRVVDILHRIITK